MNYREPYDQEPTRNEQYEHRDDTDLRQRSNRAVGVFAALLAVVVLLSALAGSIWLIGHARLSIPAAVRRDETVANVDTEPVSELLLADASARDKHFSLEDAARRASTADKKALSVRDIAATVKPAVVAITTDISVQNYLGDSYQAQAAGSGFIISDKGYVVTNAHVVENATGIKVFLEDGRTFDATLVGADRQTDVAVLKIDASDLTTVALGDSDALEVGELAVAIGNPTGRLSGTVTAGIISALNRQVEDFSLPLIQTDATINKGNSGGALINSFGEVIGINTLKIATVTSGFSTSTFEGLNFAIPMNEAKPVIEALIKEGRVRRATIGISTATITADMAEMRPELTPGELVRQVQPGSAAADAGIMVGDTIIRFNGEDIVDRAQLRKARDEAGIGSRVEVVIVRDGKEKTLELELREE